jgi:inorganic pyrophosphatase
VDNYDKLPDFKLNQIAHFFTHYKDLEDHKWTNIVGWGDADEARKAISEAIVRAKG